MNAVALYRIDPVMEVKGIRSGSGHDGRYMVAGIRHHPTGRFQQLIIQSGINRHARKPNS
jgi:hypothetical protein